VIGGDLRHVTMTLPVLMGLLGGSGIVGGIAGYWFAVIWLRTMGWLLGSSLYRPP
jgi:hypothetical protein